MCRNASCHFIILEYCTYCTLLDIVCKLGICPGQAENPAHISDMFFIITFAETVPLNTDVHVRAIQILQQQLSTIYVPTECKKYCIKF